MAGVQEDRFILLDTAGSPPRWGYMPRDTLERSDEDPGPPPFENLLDDWRQTTESGTTLQRRYNPHT